MTAPEPAMTAPMTPRQAHALLNPPAYADMDPRALDAYKRVRPHPRGLLMTVLAVDRQARLNDGLPVWHVSASLWSRSGHKLGLQRPAEAAAIRLLAGVGGDREWWWWNPAALVGHFRVAVTPEEFALIPPGCALSDAGEAGPERSRTRVSVSQA